MANLNETILSIAPIDSVRHSTISDGPENDRKRFSDADSDDTRIDVSGASFASPIAIPKSYGVLKSEAAAKWMTTKYIWFIFGCIAVAAYWIGLNQYLEGTYETEALSTSFGQHSLIATINTVQGIMQASSQPPIAKLTDMLGRFESYLTCLFLYTLGHIVVSTSPNIGAYAVGMIINTLGLTGFWLVTQIIIADNTSTRSRLFWSIFPSVPGIINVWVSGDVGSAIILNESLGWRFGFAMFTFVVPICLSPAILALAWAQRKARKMGYLDNIKAPWKDGKAKEVSVTIARQADLIGLFLMVAGFSLLLIPMTIARAAGNSWSDAKIPIMMVIGALTFAGFIFWEWKYASHPILPLRLLKNRTIIVCFLIAFFHPAGGSIQGNYLFTWYRVAADESILSATRLSNLGSLGTIACAVLGLVVVKIPYLKPFIIFGTCLQTMTLGLMTRFRGQSNSLAELAAMQVLKGIANGFIAFPVQAALQSACKHENVALITSAWLALYYIGRAVGSAIGGAIWGSRLPSALLAAFDGNQALASSVYRNPIGWIGQNGFDNPQRQAVAEAYSDGQRIILISAAAVSALSIILACCLENIKLGKTITLEQFEGQAPVKAGQASHNEKTRQKLEHDSGK